MKNTSFKPLMRAVIIGMWIFLLITPTLFASQTWVVAEMFTATTCGFCPAARSALNQMYRNREQFPYLIPIIWQGNGTHQSPAYATRRTLYGFTGIPHARFNGNVEVRGGGAAVLQNYTNAYNTVVPRNAPMEISVLVNVNAQNRLVVRSDFVMTGNINTPSNNVIIVLTYDLTGTMDPDYFASAYSYDAVAFPLTQEGQETTITRDYAIPNGWQLDRIKAVVFVQSLVQANPIVHQGAFGFVGQYEPVDVTGRVLGSDAPNGIEGAVVRMIGGGGEFQTESGENGNFTLEEVLGNEMGVDYVLSIAYQGYETHFSNRQVRNVNLNVGNVTIHQSIHTPVTGRVIGSDLPNGLPGATVRISRTGANYETETGANGNFAFQQVRTTAQGVEYEIEVTKEGYTSYVDDFEVAAQAVNLGIIEVDEIPHPVHDVWAAVSDDDPDAVDLVWTKPAPVTGTEQWIHWDSGINTNGIGTNAAVQFSVASRFTPGEYEDLDIAGLHITAVKFFPREANAVYTVKVWRGGGVGPIRPGQEVASQQAANPTIGQWNEVVLNNPVEILPDQEIWFGYHINAQAGHPAGCDSGPALNNYGNIMHFNNEWTNLIALNAQLNYNWNIQAWAGFTRGDRSVKLDHNGGNSQEEAYSFTHSGNDFASVFSADPRGDVYNNTSSGTRRDRTGARNSFVYDYRLLEGYDIYRFKAEDQDDPEAWTFVATAEDTTYTDEGWGVHLPPGEYSYAIVAVYTNEVYADPAISNSLLNRMHSNVNVAVSSNSGDPIIGAAVTLVNVDGNPDHIYQGQVNPQGNLMLQGVWKGRYNINARLSGFDRYQQTNVLVEDDNALIEVELVESLRKVVDLNYELFNDNNVRLDWLQPGTVLGTPQWLSWDDGANHTGVGTGSAAQFMVASRFSVQNITELDIAGLHLTSMKFFPKIAEATYTLKVWRGGQPSPLYPGDEVLSQPVTAFTNNVWNTVVLNEMVHILPDQEIWFGYAVNTPEGHPAGADDGPAVNNFGNLMYFNNAWTTLQAVAALNFNWNIQAYAGTEDDLGRTLISRSRLEQTLAGRDGQSERALLGYKVKRNGAVIADDLEYPTYRDLSLPIGNYVYDVIAKYTTGESDPFSTSEIVVLGVEDTEGVPLVTELKGNYPNPFNPDTKISFSLAAEEDVVIEIYNLRGQLVRTLVDERMASGLHNVVWDGTGNSGKEVGSGIYFYRMSSGSYTTSRKMILMK